MQQVSRQCNNKCFIMAIFNSLFIIFFNVNMIFGKDLSSPNFVKSWDFALNPLKSSFKIS